MGETGKIAWGILSTAKIGVEKVIPAMQEGRFSTVAAIASRDAQRAQSVARKLGIPAAYGSYEELLGDHAIQAVYIPLPNHLHVPWAIKCLEAGKHVLCEKPIAINAHEAEQLRQKASEFPNLMVMEAFMYKFHPQWQTIRTLLRSGGIGTLRWIRSYFCYHNLDPENIRNQAETGGGGLLDIGCYCISTSRFLFEAEPVSVRGSIEHDPVTKTDRLASGMLEFPEAIATFTCSTQLLPGQGAHIHGTKGRIEIEFPFTPPPDARTRVWVHRASGTEDIEFEPFNQYTLQGDAFSNAIITGGAVPTSLTDAVDNMRVIDRILEDSQQTRLL